MSDLIKIALCINEKYAPHFTVTLTSILMHNNANRLEFFLISPPLSENSVSKIQEVCVRFSAVLHFVYIDAACVAKLRDNLHLSHAAYYRLLLPNLLPDETKVLYLDCDLVVEANLQALWDTDVSQFGCAGITEPSTSQLAARLGLGNDFYINSGVLIINLDYWREHGTVSASIEWLEANPSLAVLSDQDAINFILKGKKLALDTRWNINPVNLGDFSRLSDYPSRIIHYAGPVKPWHRWSDFGTQSVYWKYLALTPWHKDITLEEPLNAGQAVAVANQFYKAEDFLNACKYYNAAINFRITTQKLESSLLFDSINGGHRHYNGRDYFSACEHYRACFNFWGFPIEYDINIYQIPGVIEGTF